MAKNSPPALSYRQTPVMKDYVLTERLGSGSYATVYKGFSKKRGDHPVAIKCIDRKKLTNKLSSDNLLTEIAVMKELDHEHVVKLKDFEWNESYIFLILEYCDGGDLSIFIQKKVTLDERDARKFLRQLASALQFLREKGISHMDLKPQNLLLSGHGSNTILKVADFGMAQHLHAGDLSKKYGGSPLYMAPEIMLGLPYDAKVDLWSVGVILYETIFGEAPFASKTLDELESKILDSAPVKIPTSLNVSIDCKDLLEHLFQRTPEDRISFQDFFNHPFVDLKHIPGPQCLPNAREAIRKAIVKDSEGSIKEALELYTEAIEYFIPAMEWKENQPIRKELKSAVTQYISRAEDLKQMLCDKRPTTRHPEAESLLEFLKSSNAKVKTAYMKISLAEEAEKHSKYKAAFELYRDAVELLFSVRGDCTSQRQSLLLQTEIQFYLVRTEEVQVLSRQRPRFGLLRSLSNTSESSESRCRVQ